MTDLEQKYNETFARWGCEIKRRMMLEVGIRELISRWSEGDFDLPDYVRGKMDGCHQCANELRALLEDDDE